AQESAGNNEFDATIKNLQDLSALLGDISTRLGKVNEFVQAGDISSIEAYLDQIDALAKNISGLVGQINVPDITAKVQSVLT
ncbi:hypothetical protein, partial [Pseudomonas protegens]|nr:hypothetical protein [Pseudomonas protegens]